ncbi:MAG: MFS transporter [Hyphomicrobiales bacterium]|nr:MFS transporter [Hyphomicrobiales bacterium]
MITAGRTGSAFPILATLAGATLLASLGISIVSVALPTLTVAFSAPISDVQWAVLAYLMAVTVTVVMAGRLADLHGHRRMLIIGLAIFFIASVFCAISPTLAALVASRAIQGIGGAILMALPISIARNAVAKDRIGSAMGLLGTMSAIGTALGPSVGGLLIVGFGWRAAFILLAGLGALALALAMSAIPAEPARTGKAKTAMDWPGAILLAATLAAYALATSRGKAALGWSTGLLLAIAALALACFVITEWRSRSPLVPVLLLRAPGIAIPLALNVLVATVMMSTLVVGPFFLSFGLRLNDGMVGIIMAAGPVTAALAGVPAGRLTDRFGAPRILAAGLIEIFVGLVCLAFLPRWFGVAGYVISLAALTPGFQLFLAANNTVVMASASDDGRGMLSGLLGLSRNLGFMTGASTMAMLFAAAMGTAEVSKASGQIVGHAFTTTFLIAAGLMLLALILALVGQQGLRQESTAGIQHLGTP